MTGQWLHNSGWGGTRSEVVSANQRAVHGPPVVFSLLAFLQRDDPELPAKLQQKLVKAGLEDLTDDELELAFARDVAAGRINRGFDATSVLWEGVLIGWTAPATHSEAASLSRGGELLFCADLALTVAVLARCESQLYLGHRQPDGTLRELAAREVVFDDARLARLSCLEHLPPRRYGRNESEALDVQRTLERAKHEQSKREKRNAAARKRRAEASKSSTSGDDASGKSHSP